MSPLSSLRVVHLVERLDRGGLERTVETLARGSAEQGLDVQVWTFLGGGAIADSLEASGIPVRKAVEGRAALRPGTVFRLAGRLRREQIDVIHGHGYLPSILARAGGFLAGTPCRLGHRHTTSEGERLRHRILEKAASLAGGMICCSDAARESYARAGGGPVSRTEVIYNGVDTDRFRPAAAGYTRSPRTLVAVSALKEHKGLRVLLQALARLRSSGVSADLLLVGAGPLETELRELTNSLDLQGQVAFAGEHEDVRPFLTSADLFVQPSTVREGLGIAALEAMSCELPVVASRLGGLAEVVVHRRTGLLVPPGDPDALVSALAEILRRPEWAAALGKEGRRRVIRGFDRRRMLERVHNLYRRELGEPASRKVVLYLSSRTTCFGGGQEGLRMTASGLSGSRYEPLVVTPGPGPLNALLESERVRTICSPLPRLRSIRLDRVLRAVLRLRRLVRTENPALVHVDDTRTALYSLCLPGRIPRIWHLRDARPDPLDRWLAPCFQRLVAVGTAAATRFLPYRAEAVAIVRNASRLRPCLAEPSEVRAGLSVREDETMLLAVGRVEPEKGWEELLRATAILAEKGVPIRTFVAGSAAGSFPRRLRRLAESLGVDRRFRLLGRREDIPDLMGAADILVHPSWFEAAPRAVLEAMAAGLPVVATAVEGNRDVLGETGKYVPPGDLEALASELNSLAEDPAARGRLASAGRKRSRELFSPDQHQAAILDLYDRLTAEKEIRR